MAIVFCLLDDGLDEIQEVVGVLLRPEDVARPQFRIEALQLVPFVGALRQPRCHDDQERPQTLRRQSKSSVSFRQFRRNRAISIFTCEVALQWLSALDAFLLRIEAEFKWISQRSEASRMWRTIRRMSDNMALIISSVSAACVNPIKVDYISNYAEWPRLATSPLAWNCAIDPRGTGDPRSGSETRPNGRG